MLLVLTVGAVGLGGGASLGCNLADALNADSAGDTESTGGADATSAANAGSGNVDGGSEDAATTEAIVAACNGRELRVATYNIESVSPVGSDDYDALGSTLLRIDADLVCVQEIVDGEAVAFGALADAAGYDYVLKAERSPAIGGELSNGCLSRAPLSVVGSWGGGELSDDVKANDVGRDLLAVRMDLSGDAPCHLGVITLHAKSGQEPIDWFRRQVEAERLGQAIERYREAYPDDAIVVMGDFNESLSDDALGTVFDAPPAGLPNSYSLGSDIAFPLTYQPFALLSGYDFELTSPTQEDAPDRRQTWRDIARLDYVFLSEAEFVDGEVYNACRDDGVDEAPPGDVLEKSGEPLACAVSELASDHFPVVVDIRIP